MKIDNPNRRNPMTTLTIFDPAMCCSTGICGAEIDQKLVDFAGDLDWLKSQGIDVKRINLSQEPALFAENDLVKSVLEKSGVEGLPVIIAGDAMMSSGLYPARNTLAEMVGLSSEQIQAGANIAGKSSGCCGGDKAEADNASSGGCCGNADDQQESSSSCC